MRDYAEEVRRAEGGQRGRTRAGVSCPRPKRGRSEKKAGAARVEERSAKTLSLGAAALLGRRLGFLDLAKPEKKTGSREESVRRERTRTARSRSRASSSRNGRRRVATSVWTWGR